LHSRASPFLQRASLCSDQAPNTIKVGTQSVIIGAAPSVPTNVSDSSVPENKTQAPPAPSQPTASRIPSTPTGFRVELWLPLPEAETITATIKILWDDSTLDKAQRYSSAAAEEIYRWRLHRSRLFKRRVGASELGSSHPTAEAHFDLSKLWIADLKEIDKVSHTSLTEIDRVIHEQFRAPLPDTSYGVNIGTAAQIVAAVLTLLAAALVAYVRVACNAGAKSTSGTAFNVLTKSLWGEFVIYVVLAIPLASVAYLDVSIRLKGTAGLFLSGCTIAMTAMTLSILNRLFPSKARNLPPLLSRLRSF
jgi:hypothetical protein